MEFICPRCGASHCGTDGMTNVEPWRYNCHGYPRPNPFTGDWNDKWGGNGCGWQGTWGDMILGRSENTQLSGEQCRIG